MRAALARVVAYLLAVGAASCSRGSSNDTAGASSAAGSAVSAAAASGAAAAKPITGATSTAASAASAESCALVTKADAEAILGQPLRDLAVATNGMCEYKPLADVGDKKMAMAILVEAKLYPNQTKQTFESETQTAANILHVTRKPRTDLGEMAYEYGDFQLMVLQHGKAISLARLKSVDPAKLEAFARKAVSRM